MIQNYNTENKGLNQFLLAQNKLLTLEVQQLKEILAINRESLRVCIQVKNGEVKLPAIINLLYQQNTKLMNRLNQLTYQVDQKLCQALISDQIAMQFQKQQKWVIENIKDQLAKLKKLLHKRQVEISELKAKRNLKHMNETQQDHQSFISTPKMSTMLINQSLTILRSQLSQKVEEIRRIKEQKQELLKLNLILTKKLSELKASSTIRGSMISTKQQYSSLKTKDYSQFISYQKRMQGSIDGSDSQTARQFSQSDYESDKVDEEDIHINLHEKSKIMVPKLQLTKAKALQSKIVQQINKQSKKQKQQNSNIKTFKYVNTLQIQMDKLKKQLGKAVQQKISQQKTIKFLKRFIKELENRNKILCESNKNKQIIHQAHRRQEVNKQTLIDICRDVVMNQELNFVLEGKIKLKKKKQIYSQQI